MKNRLTEIFGTRTVLCDGAMGTSLYARGIFINRCYDESICPNRNLFGTVHEEYLQAGAEIIETNTFGANALRLQRYGLADKVSRSTGPGLKWRARQSTSEPTSKAEGVDCRASDRWAYDWSRWEKSGSMRRTAAFAEQIRGLVGGRSRSAADRDCFGVERGGAGHPCGKVHGSFAAHFGDGDGR